jgi:NADPH-dependent 2,4-dienoyl-CoA reductase/sulfur reductase-like enzyme
MIKTDIAVIGGSAAGLTAAITARRHYPDKKITLIRKEKKVLIPCGIPYIFGTVGTPDKNLMPDAALEKNNVELVIREATDINREKKTILTKDGEIGYDKLIIATGSKPVMPPIPGFELEGVYAVVKDIDYLSALQKKLETVKEIVIIGGGFIGIEFADEINKLGGKNVTVVEIAPHCLNLAYDEEFCEEMENHLRDRGINILTSTKVERIAGREKVEKVIFSNGDEIKADVVILGIGSVAHNELARKAKLRIGLTGGIEVDRTMKTSDDHIFCCGDCAEKVSFFGGKASPLKLASIASLEARIAGANLYGLYRENGGTIGVWSTAVGDLALATAGLTEEMAKVLGYGIVVAKIEGPNRHPGMMPGAKLHKLKLVFEKTTGVLLGGQVLGGESTGEISNIISACIISRMTTNDISMFQVGTHPALTSSPVAYPLINAAEMAIGQMKKAK